MRGEVLTLLASVSVLGGCISEPSAPTLPAEPPASIGGAANGPQSSSTSTSTTTPTKADTPTSTLELLQEEVYVLMTRIVDGEHFLCTGTLVSKDRVVTAAHCLDGDTYGGYHVVAPLAAGTPRVTASNPTPMATDTEDNAASPDFGFLTLDQPIDLPAYGILTDISERVDNGEKLTATAVVRTAQEEEAPFHAVDSLNLKSTTDLGYEHGFGVNLFSHGGDSGAGLFLVENGRPTHKIIGVARQPDPDTNTDQLTRIDADILAWFHENAGE